jgi:hypothetical protein
MARSSEIGLGHFLLPFHKKSSFTWLIALTQSPWPRRKSKGKTSPKTLLALRKTGSLQGCQTEAPQGKRWTGNCERERGSSLSHHNKRDQCSEVRSDARVAKLHCSTWESFSYWWVMMCLPFYATEKRAPTSHSLCVLQLSATMFRICVWKMELVCAIQQTKLQLRIHWVMMCWPLVFRRHQITSISVRLQLRPGMTCTQIYVARTLHPVMFVFVFY